MNRSRPQLCLSAAAVISLAACSNFRWSGYYVRGDEKGAEAEEVSPEGGVLRPYTLPSREEEEEFLVRRSSAARAHEAPFTAEDQAALYYYDLGPKKIDVSRYSKRQQQNYEVFRQVCSRCHTLARAINSPRSTYWAWEFYVFNMRLRSQFEPPTAFTREQGKLILDFLAYDSKVRKERKRTAFEVLTKKLERRFDRMLDERVGRMQRGQPLIKAPQ